MRGSGRFLRARKRSDALDVRESMSSLANYLLIMDNIAFFPSNDARVMREGWCVLMYRRLVYK